MEKLLSAIGHVFMLWIAPSQDLVLISRSDIILMKLASYITASCSISFSSISSCKFFASLSIFIVSNEMFNHILWCHDKFQPISSCVEKVSWGVWVRNRFLFLQTEWGQTHLEGRRYRSVSCIAIKGFRGLAINKDFAFLWTSTVTNLVSSFYKRFQNSLWKERISIPLNSVIVKFYMKD